MLIQENNIYLFIYLCVHLLYIVHWPLLQIKITFILRVQQQETRTRRIPQTVYSKQCCLQSSLKLWCYIWECHYWLLTTVRRVYIPSNFLLWCTQHCNNLCTMFYSVITYIILILMIIIIHLNYVLQTANTVYILNTKHWTALLCSVQFIIIYKKENFWMWF